MTTQRQLLIEGDARRSCPCIRSPRAKPQEADHEHCKLGARLQLQPWFSAQLVHASSIGRGRLVLSNPECGAE
jgi:hypothetical protein